MLHVILGRLGQFFVGALDQLRAATHAASEAVASSIWPDTDAEARIVDRQLDIMRTNTRLIPYAIPAAGVAGALSVWEWVDPITLGVWLGLLVVLGVLHEWVGRRFEKRPRVTIRDVRRRSVAMTLTCFVYLLVWSSFGVWAWAPDIMVSHYLVAFVLGCTLAAACTMGAVHLATVVGVAVPAGSLMVLQPLITDALNPMTGISVVYVVLMAAFARSSHLTTARSLVLEEERAALIDGLRRARDESDTARKRAEAASVAKSEFLANMSHDLRTPLNAIIGFSDIIRGRSMGPVHDKYVEYSGFINESGKHLLTMISEMLELAKIEAGRKALREETIELDDLLAGVVEEVQGAARERDVKVEKGATAVPYLYADRHALRQILDQIVTNAVKFTPARGFVSVCAQMSDAGEIVLMVADNGVGIDLEEQMQVFDGFGSGQHDVAKKTNKGTGLGLPIAKGLVELHGGRIVLHSAPGEGTRVSIVFPAKRTVRTHLRAVGA